MRVYHAKDISNTVIYMQIIIMEIFLELHFIRALKQKYKFKDTAKMRLFDSSRLPNFRFYQRPERSKIPKTNAKRTQNFKNSTEN